jgi:hypothetical protein
VLGSHPDESHRFQTLSLRLLGRNPVDGETAIWKRSLERAKGSVSEDPAAAGKLLAIGRAGSSPGLDPVEHAAWTALCLNLLNLDEVLTKE